MALWRPLDGCPGARVRTLPMTPETVKAASSPMLDGYLRRHYRGPAMVISAAGNVDHDKLVAMSQERFGDIGAEPGPEPLPATYLGGDAREVREQMETQIMMGFEGLPYGSPDFYTGQILASVIGGGMSSRLFQEVREKRGLCYAIYTFHAAYSDTGFFGLYTGTDPADAPEMMDVIVDEMNEAAETLTGAEVARAKAQMKAGLLMGLENCSTRAEQMARHILAYGRPLPVEELVARIEAVSVESTRAAGRALLSRSRPAVVALGAGRGLDSAVGFAEGLAAPKPRALLH